MSTLRVYVSQLENWGRNRRMVILRENVDMTRAVDKYQGEVISQGGNGTFRISPLPEGELPKDEDIFLNLPERLMDEFLKAMAVELIRLGYVTGDPYGTKLKAMEDHLATVQRENDRKHDLLNSTISALIAQPQQTLRTVEAIATQETRRHEHRAVDQNRE